MMWKQMVKDLELPNEEQILALLKKSPADPLIYIIKVQDKIGLKSQDYYRILMKKYEEERNEKLYKVVREFEYILRDDREREKTW